MSLLHRLNLSSKFIALGFISLLMLLLPSTESLSDIDVAQREVQGSGPLVVLNKVIQLTQTHRGMSAGMLSENPALAAKRLAMRDQVVKAMNAVDVAFKHAEVSAQTQTHWRDLRQRWLALEQGVATRQLKTHESTKLHTQLIAQELLLSEELLNEFGLSLDPDPDTNLLIHASLINMPLLAENPRYSTVPKTAVASQASSGDWETI